MRLLLRGQTFLRENRESRQPREHDKGSEEKVLSIRPSEKHLKGTKKPDENSDKTRDKIEIRIFVRIYATNRRVKNINKIKKKR